MKTAFPNAPKSERIVLASTVLMVSTNTTHNLYKTLQVLVSFLISCIHGRLDNLLQIHCDTHDHHYNPEILRKRNPDDLVEIIQRLQQEAVVTGKLFMESKTQAQRVCASCVQCPEGQ